MRLYRKIVNWESDLVVPSLFRYSSRILLALVDKFLKYVFS